MFDSTEDVNAENASKLCKAACETGDQGSCFISTNACNTMDCETSLAECYPTYHCESDNCHTNDGCVVTQSGHLECCPYTEEGDCHKTTECLTVNQACPSVDACLLSVDICPVSEDCQAQTTDCYLSEADNGCQITLPSVDVCYETQRCEDDTFNTDCMDETRTCGE